MPKAINGVFVRILVFYIGATFVMFAIWPWDQLSGVGSSFVRVFSEIGIPAAASIINFVVITASISGINSGIYIFSRHTCTTWPNRADAVLASRIVELRKQLEKDGPDAGTESIAARPEREGVGPPANSAIYRILVSAGPVRPEPGKRPRRRTRGSRRPRPTNCGSRTSPTGRSPRFREPWSSPGSTTTPATRCTRVRSPR